MKLQHVDPTRSALHGSSAGATAAGLSNSNGRTEVLVNGHMQQAVRGVFQLHVVTRRQGNCWMVGTGAIGYLQPILWRDI